MDAIDRARELGAEHGERDARAWLENGYVRSWGVVATVRTARRNAERGEPLPYRSSEMHESLRLPEPDLSGGQYRWNTTSLSEGNRVIRDFENELDPLGLAYGVYGLTADDWTALCDAYCDAYREARDRVIREAVES